MESAFDRMQIMRIITLNSSLNYECAKCRRHLTLKLSLTNVVTWAHTHKRTQTHALGNNSI